MYTIWQESGSEKVYVLYTHLNIDNYGQPLKCNQKRTILLNPEHMSHLAFSNTLVLDNQDEWWSLGWGKFIGSGIHWNIYSGPLTQRKIYVSLFLDRAHIPQYQIKILLCLCIKHSHVLVQSNKIMDIHNFYLYHYSIYSWALSIYNCFNFIPICVYLQ